MKQRTAHKPRAKALKLDRHNAAATRYAFLFLTAGLLIGQLLLLISP